jgi:glycosyltransferase involved in cell wall biosynthesis
VQHVHLQPGPYWHGLSLCIHLTTANLTSPPPSSTSNATRFERKKGLELAVKALAELRRRAPEKAGTAQLILAGGCDARVAENQEYHAEMQQLVEQLGLKQAVLFVQSFTDR